MKTWVCQIIILGQKFSSGSGYVWTKKGKIYVCIEHEGVGLHAVKSTKIQKIQKYKNAGKQKEKEMY